MSKVVIDINVKLIQRINEMQNILDEFTSIYSRPTIKAKWKWRKITRKFDRLVDDILIADIIKGEMYYREKAKTMDDLPSIVFYFLYNLFFSFESRICSHLSNIINIGRFPWSIILRTNGMTTMNLKPSPKT